MQLIRLYAVLAWPVIPSTSARILASLGFDEEQPIWPGENVEDELAVLPAGREIGELGILFRKIPPEEVLQLEAEFGGREGSSAASD